MRVLKAKSAVRLLDSKCGWRTDDHKALKTNLVLLQKRYHFDTNMAAETPPEDHDIVDAQMFQDVDCELSIASHPVRSLRIGRIGTCTVAGKIEGDDAPSFGNAFAFLYVAPDLGAGRVAVDEEEGGFFVLQGGVHYVD